MTDKINITAPGLIGTDVSFTAFGKTVLITDYGVEPEGPSDILDLKAGHMHTVNFALTDISAGKTVARSDGKTTVDLRDLVEAQVLTAQGPNGAVQINVSRLMQWRGHPLGDNYWLPTDENERFVFEPGQRHRKIYVSGAPIGSAIPAMDQTAIAAHWNAANGTSLAASSITGAWLRDHPEYGGSPALPLSMSAYNLLFSTLYGGNKPSRSDWILHERGYTYTRGSTNNGYVRGEDELHPLVFGSYGTGPRPKWSGGLNWNDPGWRYVAFLDIDGKAAIFRHCFYIICENSIFGYSGSESQIADSNYVTYNGVTINNTAPAPVPGSTSFWKAREAIVGLYSSGSYGAYVRNCGLDHNGWGDGYDFNRSMALPRSPNSLAHNGYFTTNTIGTEWKNNLITRGASCGLQNRAGGQYEGNVFLDNNLQTSVSAGDETLPIASGQFTNFFDNIAMSAGHKDVNENAGALANGFNNFGYDKSHVGCVLAHKADPDNPAEIAAKTENGKGAGNADLRVQRYNDSQVYRWNETDWEVAGLDPAVLDQTTAQRYTAQLLGQPTATIDDLVQHVTQEEVWTGAVVQDMVRWVKGRFGRPLPNPARGPENAIFRADGRLDGFRWDTRYNWSTGDQPGVNPLDTADLDGHDVVFGNETRTVAALKSRGGTLDVVSGRLTASALTDALDATVRRCGQLRIAATTQPVKVAAESGRVALTGAVSNLDLAVRGKAQALLGPNAAVPSGKKLTISGQRAMAGWDGTGSATLTIASGGTLEFVAGLTLAVGGGLYSQRFVRTGNPVLGRTSGFTAMLADYEQYGDGTNNPLVLCDLTGLPVAGELFEYAIEWAIAENRVKADMTVTSILSRGIPMLQRFRSGSVGNGLVEPTVTASLVLAAGSSVVIGRRDLLLPGSYDLTGPGVTVTNNGATLPAGVSVTGGKLVLVV